MASLDMQLNSTDVTASQTVTRKHRSGYHYSSSDTECGRQCRVTGALCMIITTLAERLLATLVYLMLILAGDVESNPGPTLSDKPTIQELTILRKGDGSKLEVIKWITAHEEWKCEDFANLLLRDDVQVKAYLSDRMGKNNFVRTVLKDWLARDDDDELAVPRTWEALTKSISDAGLAGTLAKAIRDACQPSAPAVPSMAPPSQSPLRRPPVVAAVPDTPPADSDLQLHGVQQRDAPDPSSYWNLHGRKYEGEGTTLMVFDTGIDKNHPSFASKGDKLWLPQGIDCNDEEGHGTRCAGIACGDEVLVTKEDGSIFTCRGVAPAARLGVWKKPHKEATYWMTSLIEYIGNNEESCIDVLVIPSGFLNPPDPLCMLQDDIQKLDKLGIIVVCSGSNEGAIDVETIAYPARYEETICVGYHAHNGERSRDSFSPQGSAMDFLALGDQVYVPLKGSRSFESHTGTSYAAPALGGLICLILETLRESCEDDIPCGQKLDRQFIVHLLKLLINQKSESKDVKCGYGAISPAKLDDFFSNPKYFITTLKMNKIIRKT